VLSLPEVYKYSSNIGTIRIMQQWGKDNFRAFLTKLGFDRRVPFELPEMRSPTVPDKFSEIVAATRIVRPRAQRSARCTRSMAYAASSTTAACCRRRCYKRSEAEARRCARR
jgi:cell division protein FtsI (penicillin-binding protein 3)